VNRALSLGLVMALVAASAWGQAYRWVDKDGRVHYTQTPPPADARDVRKKKLGGNIAESSNLPYATQRAAQNFPVTLYTSPDCGAPCDNARSNLVKRGVPFREINVVDQKSGEDLKRVSGKIQLPTLVVGSQVQSGFLEDAYKGALDDAGYPSSAPQVPLEALRKMEPVAKPAAAPPESNPSPAPEAEVK
jgi:glutaredoxin